MKETLPTLLIKFAQRESLSYEEVLTKANRVIHGGWNEFMGWNIVCTGGNAEEREASLRKSLADRYSQ